MTLEEALVSFLLADTAVTGLIDERLSPWSGQGEGLPRVAYDYVSTQDDRSVFGSTDQPVVQIRFLCLGNTQAEARAVAKALRESRGGQGGKRLKEFQGSMAGLWVQSCSLENESDVDVQSQQADGRPLPARVFDLTIGFIQQ